MADVTVTANIVVAAVATGTVTTGGKGEDGTGSGATSWDDLTGKPAVIGAGADAAAARAAIGAGTSSLAIGTSGSTAAAGNDSRLSDTRTPTDNSVATLKLIDANVTLAKLSAGVQTSLGKADTALQSAPVTSVAALTGAVAASALTDALTDGTTNHVFTAADDTKLTGVATSATANASDAALRDRTTHTGVQTSATISDFAEAAQDALAAALAGTSGVSVTYDDAANTITVTGLGDASATAETIRDAIGVALVGVGVITVTPNDALDTITISSAATTNSTDAALRDRSTHTGSQTASTVSDFSTAADARITAAAATGTGSLVRATSPALVTPTGIVKGDVGLGNVDNTSNATERAAVRTLTNASISLGSNTVTMTKAQLNTAVSDADVAVTTGPFPPDQLAAGFATLPRWGVNVATLALATGTMQLTFFTADKTQSVSGATVRTGSTAAAATPTLCRIGLFSVAANGDIALIASTPNDTTLFAAASTTYTKAFSASVGVTLGDRLAVGILVVSGAAMPTMAGNTAGTLLGSAEMAIASRLAGQVASLSDLPSSTVAASIANNTALIYSRVA
jgi:hypothetical protein